MFEVRPLRFLRNLGRSREIATVLLNHGFNDVVERLHLWRYLQWWRRLRRRQPEPRLTRPQRIRLALEELGPTFVKFGQVMSTRPDLVPPEVIRELTQLQERVPPFSSQQALKLIEEELGSPPEKMFAEFDPEPLAAGSLGQVHWARHFDGTPLAVKIRRPNVVREIERDLSLLFELAPLVERHIPESEIFDPVGLVNQLARSIRREINFTREGRTMDEFRRLFRNDATLVIPRVYWDLSTEAIVTQEFIEGLKVGDREALMMAGYSPQELAANGARIFMRMAFELGLFHGDPHPGNLRVLPGGVLGLLDYGLVGRLEEDKREQLIDLFLAIVKGDVRLAVEQVLLIGKPFRPVDRPLLQSDIRDFVETYYGLSLDRVDMGRLLSDFVGILAQHGIRYPADLMLLIRCIITLEGVGRSLDASFNLAEHLAPLVEQLVRERYNPKRLAQRVATEVRSLAEVMHDLPVDIGRTLHKLSTDDLRFQLEHRGLDHLITELDRSSNRVIIGLVLSALIVASALIVRTAQINAWWFAVPTFVLSSLLGIWLIYGIFRSGRL